MGPARLDSLPQIKSVIITDDELEAWGRSANEEYVGPMDNNVEPDHVSSDGTIIASSPSCLRLVLGILLLLSSDGIGQLTHLQRRSL